MAASVRIRFFVDGSGGQHLLHFSQQLGPVFRHGLGASGLDLLHQAEDRLAPRQHVRGQRRALGRAHGIKLLQRRGDRIRQRGGPGLLVLVRLLHQEDVRQPGEHRHGDIIPDAVLGDHGAHGGQISLHHRAVQGHGHVAAGMVDGQIDVHLAPAHLGLDALLDAVLGIGVEPRQLDRAVEIAVIDGPDFRSDLQILKGLNRSAVTGHAFYHSRYLHGEAESAGLHRPVRKGRAAYGVSAYSPSEICFEHAI